jgi:hypothetical protein
MTPLLAEHVATLNELTLEGMVATRALPRSVGGTQACEGLWRFFSDSWPVGGAEAWNSTSSWKTAWQPYLPQGLFSFGEDVFGNQLVVVNRRENVFLLETVLKAH